MDYERHYLTSLFEPQSVAIVGASETPNSIGLTVARNMQNAGFTGKLFFVNPAHKKLFGQACFDSVERIPQRLDLAVICTKIETIPDIVDACGRAGCRVAVIISAGMNVSGAHTAAERRVLESARLHGMRLLGPESLGIVRPASGLNAAFVHSELMSGSIGIVSHSGAIGASVMDWAATNKIGVSNLVAMGAECDIDFGEVLDYMVSDPRTESIFLFIEGIKNARSFMSSLRRAARCKPVLLVKIGTHTTNSRRGNSIDPDVVFDADWIERRLFDMAHLIPGLNITFENAMMGDQSTHYYPGGIVRYSCRPPPAHPLCPHALWPLPPPQARAPGNCQGAAP